MSSKYPILDDYFYKMTGRMPTGCDMIAGTLEVDKMLERIRVQSPVVTGFGQLLFNMNKKVSESCKKLLQEIK